MVLPGYLFPTHATAVWTDLGEDQEKDAQEFNPQYRVPICCASLKNVAQQDPGLRPDTPPPSAA